jgi:exopolysaccharide biosynthesis predicted pyruvyltransferase EpsI
MIWHCLQKRTAAGLGQLFQGIHPPPTSPGVVNLARRNGEAVREEAPTASRDWPADPLALRVPISLRSRPWAARRLPGGWRHLCPSVQDWHRQAALRVRSGEKLLRRAGVLVTWRLHGVILGLRAQQRIVIIDNAISKLSRYSDGWLADYESVHLARNWNDAEEVAWRLVADQNE